MKVKIYVEGGGDSEDTITRCRQGFGAYCAKIVAQKSHPRIVPCGGRNQTFRDFISAIESSKAADQCVLLVDAEAPVTAINAVEHLKERDRWRFSVNLNGHRVFLMVQAMEAWFLADRDALVAFYGQGFLAKSLPGNPKIEAVSKGDLESSLKHASAQTKTKGEYHNVRHGFALLERIDPEKVERASPHAKLFHDFLRSL